MTREDHAVILALVVVPGRPYTGSPEAVLRHFGTDDGHGLGLRLLGEAITARNADDLELALIVCDTFGIDDAHVDTLIGLLYADWHSQHENVVSVLDRFKLPDAVEALYHAASWVPEYLQWDENRALAVKAIWALGDVPGDHALSKLSQLREAEDDVVRQAATRQLRRRRLDPSD